MATPKLNPQPDHCDPRTMVMFRRQTTRPRRALPPIRFNSEKEVGNLPTRREVLDEGKPYKREPTQTNCGRHPATARVAREQVPRLHIFPDRSRRCVVDGF